MKTACLICVVALITGCMSVPVVKTAATPVETKIEQSGFSAAKRFEFCEVNDCVKRTTKIINEPEQPPVASISSKPIGSFKE